MRDSHQPSSSGSCRFCFIRFSPVFFILFLPDPSYRSSSSISHRLSLAFFIRLLLVLLDPVLTRSPYRFLLADSILHPVLTGSSLLIPSFIQFSPVLPHRFHPEGQKCNFHVVCELHYDTRPLQTCTSSGMCRSFRYLLLFFF